MSVVNRSGKELKNYNEIETVLGLIQIAFNGIGTEIEER